jgi:predicted nuclease of restriction endonuclease-like RecB superfamily
VSKDEIWEVSEMTHDHYVKSTFFDLCRESDRVIILECKDWDEEYSNKVIQKCKDLSSAKYDTQFNLGVEALYCSELIYQSDFERRLDIQLDDLIGLNKPYISPDGLLAAKNCTVIWDSDNV